MDRSDPEKGLYDVNTFCAPFDLNRIDIEMLKKQKLNETATTPLDIPCQKTSARAPSLSSYQQYSA